MKKLMIAVCLTTVMALAAHAEQKPEGKKDHHQAQDPAMKALLDKYDTNKDGKLEKEEKAKMSKEDKAKLKEMTAPHHKKEGEKELEKKDSQAK